MRIVQFQMDFCCSAMRYCAAPRCSNHSPLACSYWAALSLSFRLISILLMNIIAWGPQVNLNALLVGIVDGLGTNIL